MLKFDLRYTVPMQGATATVTTEMEAENADAAIEPYRRMRTEDGLLVVNMENGSVMVFPARDVANLVVTCISPVTDAVPE